MTEDTETLEDPGEDQLRRQKLMDDAIAELRAKRPGITPNPWAPR